MWDTSQLVSMDLQQVLERQQVLYFDGQHVFSSCGQVDWTMSLHSSANVYRSDHSAIRCCASSWKSITIIFWTRCLLHKTHVQIQKKRASHNEFKNGKNKFVSLLLQILLLAPSIIPRLFQVLTDTKFIPRLSTTHHTSKIWSNNMTPSKLDRTISLNHLLKISLDSQIFWQNV